MPPWEKYQSNSPEGGPWSKYASPEQESVGWDVAKSLGVGLGKGLIGGTVALPGNIVDLAGRGAKWAGGKLGVDLPDPNTYNPLPTSESVQQQVEQVTGPFYRPHTNLGKYAETIGEFAGGPTSYVGKGVSMGRKLAGAALGGAASETAGQATGGSQYEPLARLAGGIAGGAASGAGRRGKVETATEDELARSTKADFKKLDNSNVTLNGDFAKQVLNTFQGQLEQAGARRYNAKPVYDVLDDVRKSLTTMRTNQNGQKVPFTRDVNMKDIQGFRSLLTNVRGNDVEMRYAKQLEEMLDHYLTQVPPHHVISGDPIADAALLRKANADYRGLKRSEAMDTSTEKAARRAASTGVGGNVENTLRQEFNKILNSKNERARYNQTEIDMMTNIVKGDTLTNQLRKLGKYAPQGPVSLMPTLALFISGHPKLAALAIPGTIAKGVAERRTQGKVNQLAEHMRANTPYGQAKRAQPPPTPPLTPYGVRGGLGAVPGAQERRPLQVDVTWPLRAGGGSPLSQEQGP